MEGHMGHDMMDHSMMGHDMSGQHDMSSHEMHDMPGHNMPGHNMPGHEMPSSCSMNMLFNWQIQDVCVVFESWHIHNVVEMFISCLVVFCIAAGYEYLRVWSSTLDNKWIQTDKKKLIDQRNLTGEEDVENDTTTAANTSFLRKDMSIARRSYKYRVLKSINYATLVAISFWLMLVFMTYNGFLMIATVLGAGFGHLVFGNGKLKAARDIQCH